MFEDWNHLDQNFGINLLRYTCYLCMFGIAGEWYWRAQYVVEWRRRSILTQLQYSLIRKFKNDVSFLVWGKSKDQIAARGDVIIAFLCYVQQKRPVLCSTTNEKEVSTNQYKFQRCGGSENFRIVQSFSWVQNLHILDSMKWLLQYDLYRFINLV